MESGIGSAIEILELGKEMVITTITKIGIALETGVQSGT